MRKGVRVAIKSDSEDYTRRLNQEAAKTMRYGGATEEEALKMITLNAAWIIGVDDRVGSIDVGKDADLVIWDGYPLSSLRRPGQSSDRRRSVLRPRAIRPRHNTLQGGRMMRRQQSSSCGAAASHRPLPLILLLLLILISLVTVPKPAFAQDNPIALKGGKLLTITHGVIENGVILMQAGKITAVGAATAVNIPSNAQVIDATGMTIYPGLIDSETSLGLTEISAETMTNDLVELSDEIMPHMHTAEAFHAESVLIPVARVNGITNAVVAPESGDTLPGQDSFIQLAGPSATEMLLIRDNAMPLNFTGDQRRNKGGFDKRKFPSTRMGLAAQLRQAFIDAQDYKAKWADYERKKADAAQNKKPEPLAPKRDLKSEALLPYLEGKKTIVLAAESPSDLETAVSLANEFKLKFVLNHISHSQPVLDYVASLKVPVIVGPIYEAPKEDERYDAVYSLPGAALQTWRQDRFRFVLSAQCAQPARSGRIRHRFRPSL